MKKYEEELLYAVKRMSQTLDRMLYLMEKREIEEHGRRMILKQNNVVPIGDDWRSTPTTYRPTIEGDNNENS